MPSELLIPRELEARRKLRQDIEGHQTTVAAALALLERSLQAGTKRLKLAENPPAQVAGALLMRLGQDVRSASLLGELGYPAQSAGCVAGAFEAVFTLAYVGSAAERAEAWLQHDKPTRVFRPVKTLIDDVAPDGRTARFHYQTYSQLCLAKHGNPLLAQQLTYQLDGRSTTVAIGPNTTESAVRAIQFALVTCVGLVTLAPREFFVSHFDAQVEDLAPQLLSLEQSWTHLKEVAIDRWGSEDPFPGKW